MRIISNFKDYYDGGMGLGMDPSIVYLRMLQPFMECLNNLKVSPPIISEIKSLALNSKISTSFIHPTNVYSTTLPEKKAFVEQFFVGFCGKLYTGFLVYDTEDAFPYRPNPLKMEDTYNTEKQLEKKSIYVCFSIEEVEKALDKTFDRGDPISRITRWNAVYKDKCLQIIENALKNNGLDVKDKFVNLSLTTFAYKAGKGFTIPERFYNISELRKQYNMFYLSFFRFNLIINPVLNDFEFIKVIDPVTAYQEISMWIGGVLPKSDNAMINITDEDRIKQHGFDKRSFRKDPTKHKGKC
jgi:hypothetical protein